MNTTKAKYGTGPQQLIKVRLPKAYLCFGVSLVVLFVPAFLYAAHDVVLPFAVYLFCLVLAGWLYRKGHYWEKRIRQAQQGGEAEDQVGKILERLPAEWKIDHSVYFTNMGDVDFVVTSPEGRTFVIDVKSHKGFVSIATGKLSIITDRKTFNAFDTSFLTKIKRQVELVALFKGVRNIEPVLVFTRAEVPSPNCVLDGVTILSSSTLLEFLAKNCKPKRVKAMTHVLQPSERRAGMLDTEARSKTAKILDKLPSGWIWQQVNHGSDYATPDFFVSSPEGKTFVLNVRTDWGRIRRRSGVVDDSEVLRHTRRHAATLAEDQNLSWVHAVVVCFDRDQEVNDREIENVHITQPDILVEVLQSMT